VAFFLTPGAECSGLGTVAMEISSQMTDVTARPEKMKVKILMLNGSEFEGVLDREDTVRDLAVWIRMNMSIPIAVQHLVHESEVLTEPSQQLSKIFPGSQAPVVTVLRRPYTTQERAELFQRLVRSTAAGEIAQVRELLKEGAPLDFSLEEQGHDTSVSLDHWDTEEASASKEEPDTKTTTQEDSKDEKDENLEEGEDGSGASEEGDSELQSPPDSDEEMVQEDAVRQVCGGLTPLFMALATGREDLARDFRQLGAKEMDLSPSSELGAAWTAQPPNVLEIARHIVAGVDPDTMLRRGQGIRATESGTMLHACAANHRQPGMYELAQLLIQKKSDLNAGDSEGDTPLAHARYFHAPDLYKLYSGHGGNVAGPFYSRWNGHGPAALYQHFGPIFALGARLEEEEL